jgi:hypothetical protein
VKKPEIYGNSGLNINIFLSVKAAVSFTDSGNFLKNKIQAKILLNYY